jgi:hypothetical protein
VNKFEMFYRKHFASKAVETVVFSYNKCATGCCSITTLKTFRDFVFLWFIISNEITLENLTFLNTFHIMHFSVAQT